MEKGKAHFSRFFYDKKLITKSYYIKDLIAYLPQENLIPASTKVKDFIDEIILMTYGNLRKVQNIEELKQ